MIYRNLCSKNLTIKLIDEKKDRYNLIVSYHKRHNEYVVTLIDQEFIGIVHYSNVFFTSTRAKHKVKSLIREYKLKNIA